MADHTITISDDAEKAGIDLLGSPEALAAELQAGIDKMSAPWIVKAQRDQQAAEAQRMQTFFAKVDSLPDEKKAEVVAAVSEFIEKAVAETPVDVDPAPIDPIKKVG